MSNESFDELFLNYAKQQEEEANKASNKGSFSREYEDVKWSILEANKPKVLRVQGGPPNSNLDNYTSRTVTLCWIIGDDGKKFKVVKPSLFEDPSYVLNKIINKVSQVKWTNNQKTFPVKDSFPDIYNLIDKNGLEETDPRIKFERGWRGREILLMNVIDRSQLDWHRENKHTMLLARNSTTSSTGTEFVDEGISSYAISSKLNHLFASYGSWEKYDIAITRTGSMQNPFTVVNATHSPMEVDTSVRSLISSNTSLTDEERSWEKYDLSKLYKYTSATKILNRLKNTLKRIDSSLGTSFLEEVTKLSEEEKKQWEEIYGSESSRSSFEKPTIEKTSHSSTPADQVLPQATKVEESSTVTTRRTSVPPSSAIGNSEEWKSLPHPEALNDEQKNMVLEVVKDNSGKVTDIKWNCPVEELAACPEEGCGIAAPLEVTMCPVCGISFV